MQEGRMRSGLLSASMQKSIHQSPELCSNPNPHPGFWAFIQIHSPFPRSLSQLLSWSVITFLLILRHLVARSGQLLSPESALLSKEPNPQSPILIHSVLFLILDVYWWWQCFPRRPAGAFLCWQTALRLSPPHPPTRPTQGIAPWSKSGRAQLFSSAGFHSFQNFLWQTPVFYHSL